MLADVTSCELVEALPKHPSSLDGAFRRHGEECPVYLQVGPFHDAYVKDTCKVDKHTAITSLLNADIGPNPLLVSSFRLDLLHFPLSRKFCCLGAANLSLMAI